MLVCVECLPADKPWDCGVCDTPELWRGAAGLNARVRACAGTAECECFKYIHTYVSSPSRQRSRWRMAPPPPGPWRALGL